MLERAFWGVLGGGARVGRRVFHWGRMVGRAEGSRGERKAPVRRGLGGGGGDDLLPRGCPRSTIGAEKLNDRVRDGNGCVLLARITAPNGRSGIGMGSGFSRLSGFGLVKPLGPLGSVSSKCCHSYNPTYPPRSLRGAF